MLTVVSPYCSKLKLIGYGYLPNSNFAYCTLGECSVRLKDYCIDFDFLPSRTDRMKRGSNFTTTDDVIHQQWVTYYIHVVIENDIRQDEIKCK